MLDVVVNAWWGTFGLGLDRKWIRFFLAPKIESTWLGCYYLVRNLPNFARRSSHQVIPKNPYPGNSTDSQHLLNGATSLCAHIWIKYTRHIYPPRYTPKPAVVPIMSRLGVFGVLIGINICILQYCGVMVLPCMLLSAPFETTPRFMTTQNTSSIDIPIVSCWYLCLPAHLQSSRNETIGRHDGYCAILMIWMWWARFWRWLLLAQIACGYRIWSKS